MDTFTTREQIEAAAAAVHRHSSQRPSVALVLGTGLNSLAEAVEGPDFIPYEEIPNWPVSTVQGHSGRLVIGQLAGSNVLVQQGRTHFYEGYRMDQLAIPARVMNLLGVETLIVTNAAGGINRTYTPGDLMLISDHINMLGLAGFNPLRGPNDDRSGRRFPDLTRPYDNGLRKVAREVASEHGITLQEGVYAYVAGPSFETPAELRYLHEVGADAVGMSTVPTVIVARHTGIRVLGISTITNKAILDPETEGELSHEEVLETGLRIIPQLTALIEGVIRRA
jgi:purine-nucleoside phosphorylase